MSPGDPPPRQRLTLRQKAGRVWEFTSYLEEAMPRSSPRLYRALMWTARRASFAILMLGGRPLLERMGRSWADRPGARLERHATEIWARSPDEAVAAIRTVWRQLSAPDQPDPVTIEPYGRFGLADHAMVIELLYRFEFGLGNHEAALALIDAVPPTAHLVLMRVDCLVAMSRRDEAVALIERSLSLDTSSEPLRKKLTELRGHLKVV